MLAVESNAIVTLSGGVDKNHELTPRNISRMDTAIELFHQGVAPNLILAGGWPIHEVRPAQTEACKMHDYAETKGVTPDVMFTVGTSRDTIGNALFTKNILRTHGWNNITLVTSQGHVPRSEVIFRHVLGPDYNIDVVGAPEERGWRERVEESLGSMVLDYVLKGVRPGDSYSIHNRLRERVPGYADQGLGRATNRQLVKFAAKTLAHNFKA